MPHRGLAPHSKSIVLAQATVQPLGLSMQCLREVLHPHHQPICPLSPSHPGRYRASKRATVQPQGLSWQCLIEVLHPLLSEAYILSCISGIPYVNGPLQARDTGFFHCPEVHVILQARVLPFAMPLAS